MVFKRLYCPLGGVDAVVVWFNELDRAIALCHVCLDGCGCLIVRDVEHGFVPLVSQHLMNLLECVQDVTVGSGDEWEGKDIISVIVVSHKK